jgi:hypothetical protein
LSHAQISRWEEIWGEYARDNEGKNIVKVMRNFVTVAETVTVNFESRKRHTLSKNFWGVGRAKMFLLIFISVSSGIVGEESSQDRTIPAKFSQRSSVTKTSKG